MTAESILAELAITDVRLSATGDRLHVEAKPGTVTLELRDRLKTHKAELLPLIRTRDRLLTVARTLGLPDHVVLDLPASELTETAKQYADFATEKGEELGQKLLVFYLRTLAGIEPALPGSLAERDAPTRRARWQA